MAEFDLLRFMTKAEWMVDANCLCLDTDLFFPARGQDTRFAKSICRACDVQVECLAYALNNGEHHGIWGGMSERDRRRIRRTRAVNATGPIPPPSELQRHEHGSDYGYQRHRHFGTEPCAECCSAHAAANYDRKHRSVTA